MYFIGLMSGTSLDGIDAVLARFAGTSKQSVDLRAHVHHAFTPALRGRLLTLQQPGPNELHHAFVAAHELADAYAEAVHDLISQAGIAPELPRAIGAHGQTVRHQPDVGNGQVAYTIQLLNGARLAERVGLDVVCDFRSADLAAGGQGAPLVPAFHAALFDQAGLVQAVLNLGGIANLTLLDGRGGLKGFDCGPGNVLLDLWCERHLGLAYDQDGAWAASGKVDAGLLASLQSEAFFQRWPPKSTGRDLFRPAWLDSRLMELGQALAPVDVQATLLELTVRCVAEELHRHLPNAVRLLVCGGGAHNRQLMRRLSELLDGVQVCSTAGQGLPPQQVEAAAFAWLADAFIAGRAGNCPAVTGARRAKVLGALHRGQT